MSEQKKIRALFYITPKFKWKYIVNWLISIWTWCRYSHVELQTPDENGVFTELMERWVPAIDVRGNADTTGHVKQCERKLFGRGTCYSSTMRGDDNGTRKADAALVLKHPENWDYIEIPVTDEQYKVLIWWLEQKVAANKGYAKRDIWKFVIGGIHKPDDERDICSELGNNGLVIIFKILGFGIVKPKKLYKKLITEGYTVKTLIRKEKKDE